MKDWLNYHHLFYFKTIAEEGSISKAARLLRLGQPTLSLQLKTFEEQLGVSLFERRGRLLHLTEDGRLTLDYAKHIFQLGKDLSQILKGRGKAPQAHLRIGALDSIPKQVILKMTQAAYRNSPCYISLTEGRPDELLRELISQRLDLVVFNFIPSLAPSREQRLHLSHKKVASSTVHIFGAPPFRRLIKCFPESLQQQPLILPTYDSRLRSDLEHWFSLRHIRMHAIAETQDIALKKLMASDGLGLIPSASYSVERHVRERKLYKIGTLDGIREEVYFITSSALPSNEVTRALMKAFSISPKDAP